MTALSPEPTAQESLKRAADQATLLARRAAEAAAAGRRGRPSSEVLSTIQELQREVGALSDELAAAATRLDIRSAVDEHAKRFSADTWTLRARELRANLERDPIAGARRWLDAWTEAVATGYVEEARRLTVEPFRLPPEAVWWPNRLAVALEALERRDPDGWAAVGTYLSGGAELKGQRSIEVSRAGALLLLESRLRTSASSDGAGLDIAEALVNRAADLLGADDCNVLAARSAVARHRSIEDEFAASGDPAVVGSAAGIPSGRGTGCVAGAVEHVRWAFMSGVGGEALLAETRAALATLSPVGVEAQIDALLEPAPGEVWIALAERYENEGLPNVGQLLDRIDDGSSFASWMRDQRRLALARAAGAGAIQLADALTQAGTTASAEGHTNEAVASLEEALELVPDHNEAMLTLADVLVVSASTKPIEQAAEILERARKLCLDAHVGAYPTDATSWSLLVLARIDRRLHERVGPGREASAWRAVLAAARAVVLSPDLWANWADLANMLMAAGRHRAADVAARLASGITADRAATDERRLLTLLNVGRNDEGIALLNTLQRSDDPAVEAWRSAMRALFVVETKTAAALHHIETAVKADPDGGLWYHELHGDCLALAGRLDDAVTEWRWVWQHAELGEYEGLLASARSALKQGLYSTAKDLCAQLAASQGGPQDAGDAAAIRGLATLAEGGDGWDDVLSAFRSKPTTGLLEDIHLLCRTMAKLSPAVDLARVDAAFEEATGRLRDTYDGLTPGHQAALELDLADEASALHEALDTGARAAGPVAKLSAAQDDGLNDVALIAASMARALCLIADGDQQGADEVIELASRSPQYPELADLATWADGLADAVVSVLTGETAEEGEAVDDDSSDGDDEDEIGLSLGHGWFEGAVLSPDALKRAVTGALAFGWPVVRPARLVAVLDPSLASGDYRIDLPDGSVAAGAIPLNSWYCPTAWHAALDPSVINTSVENPAVPGYLAFPVPSDPNPALSAMSLRPVEVLARRALEAHADSWAAATLQRQEPASLIERILAWLRRLLGLSSAT
jgi:tetratricopeptide (TPR) repeat protein